MSDRDLAVIMDAEPFVPVRLRLSNGASYDVTHPEIDHAEQANGRGCRR